MPETSLWIEISSEPAVVILGTRVERSETALARSVSWHARLTNGREVQSRRMYIERNMLGKCGRTPNCLVCAWRGSCSEEHRRKIAQELDVAGDAFDTEAMKRPHSTDDIPDPIKRKYDSKLKRQTVARKLTDVLHESRTWTAG